MTTQPSRRRSSFHAPKLTFLGTVRGTGRLSGTAEGHDDAIDYEIDSYREREKIAANGRVTGAAKTIAWAVEAGSVVLRLASGDTVDVTLKPDDGDPESAEIELTGAIPAFA